MTEVIMCSGIRFVRSRSIVRRVNTYFVCHKYTISWIWTKLGTSIHHVSGHCWKRFQGQRSKVKVMTRTNPVLAKEYMHFDGLPSSRLTCLSYKLWSNSLPLHGRHCVCFQYLNLKVTRSASFSWIYEPPQIHTASYEHGLTDYQSRENNGPPCIQIMFI